MGGKAWGFEVYQTDLYSKFDCGIYKIVGLWLSEFD